MPPTPRRAVARVRSSRSHLIIASLFVFFSSIVNYDLRFASATYLLERFEKSKSHLK